MKYIKLFEDHTTDQPEKSLEQLKSELASIAKGTFKYAAIDTVLDATVMDDHYEMEVAEEFDKNYIEVLLWIANRLGIQPDNSDNTYNQMVDFGLVDIESKELLDGMDFSKIVTLWDYAEGITPAYEYRGAGSPIQIALLKEIFPDLVKPFVNNSIKNAINIDSVNMLYLPEPYSIIDKEVNLPNAEGFIYVKIAKSMGLTFISIEFEYDTKFFVQL